MDAPAFAYSKASAPVEIPPQPINGTDAGTWGRRILSAARVYGLSGLPERPPCSALFAIQVSAPSPINGLIKRTVDEAGGSRNRCVADNDSVNLAFLDNRSDVQ